MSSHGRGAAAIGPGGALQKWATILVSAAVIALVGYLTVEQTTIAQPLRRGDAGVDEDADAARELGEDVGDAGSGAALLGEAEAGLGDLGDLPSVAPLGLDASALPLGGPRTVKVGVVLVQWQGAEGATTSRRSKSDAQGLAQDLAQQAKTEFRRAVSQGDPGSAEDIGRIPRGTLDPRTEAVLFSLPAGGVSDPVETPRGYWIVKRIE